MIGIATQFVILERTLARLKASSAPAEQQFAQQLEAALPYAYLGAIGPALADFIPSDPPPKDVPSAGGTSPYTTLWQQIFAITGGDGTDADPGMLKILTTFRQFLAKIVPAANAEDLDALKAMQDSGELDQVVKMAETLKTLVDAFTPKVFTIGAAIGAGMKPAINVSPGTPVPHPVTWTAREWMHWKHPGRFATALVARAKASGDARYIAYSFGYLCSFAGLVAGSSFVNSSIGGTYRGHWWRTRWVNNYVDTWAHGFYGANASMAGDDPTPAYPNWPGLCDAGLETHISGIAAVSLDPIDVMARLRIGDPFSAALPDDFAAYWMQAWTDAYGPGLTRVSAKALNGAFVLTWLKLWFQTSGAVLGCNPAPPMTPPSNCDAAQPAWVDPFTAPLGDNGAGATPPNPKFEQDVDEAEVVTGVVLALLGLASLFFGGGAAGVAAIVGGVALIVDGVLTFTWDELRCDLYWYQHYLHNGIAVLHNLVTLGAFSHPYPAELALDQTTMSLLGSPFTFDSGKRVVRSQARFIGHPLGADVTDEFPATPWSGVLGTWQNAPGSPWEQPLTTAYYSGAYPDFFIDDDGANPLTSTGDVKTGGGFPFRPMAGQPMPVQFGNAVANAVDLLKHVNAGTLCPDWNLDADRGLAAFTWKFVGDVASAPFTIEPEP